MMLKPLTGKVKNFTLFFNNEIFCWGITDARTQDFMTHHPPKRCCTPSILGRGAPQKAVVSPRNTMCLDLSNTTKS